MNSEFLDVLVPGAVVLIFGVLLLVALVRELEPAQRKKWFLAIGLGGGLVSFASKIILIAAFNSSPESLIHLFPKRVFEYASQPAEASTHKDVTALRKSFSWEALPEQVPQPEDNLITAEKVKLGKQLFFEKRLSFDNSVACVSCHELNNEKAGADGLPVSLGIDKQAGTRNAPTVLNAAFQRVLFWDGRAASLEEQALGPLVNPVEMGMSSLSSVEEKLNAMPDYVEAFKVAFPNSPTITAENVGKAIASYERTLVTPESAYDRFVRGEREVLSEQQTRGMALFRSHGCSQCHSGPNFSAASVLDQTNAYRIFPSIQDDVFEQRYRFSEDRGKAGESSGEGVGVWRVPSLRNVARTAPYFHNGSVETLEEAVRVMAKMQLGKQLSNESDDDQRVYWLSSERRFSASHNQALSDSEVRDIVSFLEALNGDVPEV